MAKEKKCKASSSHFHFFMLYFWVSSLGKLNCLGSKLSCGAGVDGTPIRIFLEFVCFGHFGPEFIKLLGFRCQTSFIVNYWAIIISGINKRVITVIKDSKYQFYLIDFTFLFVLMLWKLGPPCLICTRQSNG